MAKSLVDELIDALFTEKFLGWNGERLTERELNLVKLFGRKGKVIRNVYIPKDNGETSDIDVLFITQKGNSSYCVHLIPNVLKWNMSQLKLSKAICARKISVVLRITHH